MACPGNSLVPPENHPGKGAGIFGFMWNDTTVSHLPSSPARISAKGGLGVGAALLACIAGVVLGTVSV